MHRIPPPFVVVAAVALHVAWAAGCAPLTVQQAQAEPLAGVDDVAFLGAYDARVAIPDPPASTTTTTTTGPALEKTTGETAAIHYPIFSVLREGEIPPNDALKLVAQGFTASIVDAGVVDLSLTTPLRVRAGTGLDTFAKRNPSLSNRLVSVEIKSASVALDDATVNYRLGIAALSLGILSPCLACTTAPCLLYPLVAQTRATSEATGTLRVFDKRTGAVVHREDLRVTTHLEVQGFHDGEQIFALLSTETGKRLGYQAAQRVRAQLGTTTTTTTTTDLDPPRKSTPALDRPALVPGAAPKAAPKVATP